MNSPAVFTTDIEVRFADLDAYGHVNNAIFFTNVAASHFAAAKTAMVCFDHNLGRSVSIPESFRQPLHP
jgi:acyl-CoA thioesterase FadM